jgi:hypothetical protein
VLYFLIVLYCVVIAASEKIRFMYIYVTLEIHLNKKKGKAILVTGREGP